MGLLFRVFFYCHSEGEARRIPRNAIDGQLLLKAEGSFANAQDDRMGLSFRVFFYCHSEGEARRIPRNAIDGQLLLKVEGSFANAQDDGEK